MLITKENARLFSTASPWNAEPIDKWIGNFEAVRNLGDSPLWNVYHIDFLYIDQSDDSDNCIWHGIERYDVATHTKEQLDIMDNSVVYDNELFVCDSLEELIEESMEYSIRYYNEQHETMLIPMGEIKDMDFDYGRYGIGIDIVKNDGERVKLPEEDSFIESARITTTLQEKVLEVDIYRNHVMIDF